MPVMRTTAQLLVNGLAYEGWTSISVKRSLRDAAARFELGLTDKWPGRSESWPLAPGDKAEIWLDDEKVLTGFIDTLEPDISEVAHGVRVTGRSRTADLVDCAALVKGGQFQNYDLAAIARALAAPFGIDVSAEAPTGAAFADVQINPGETCFAVIERLCRLRALLASDTRDGHLRLTRAGAGGAGRASGLVYGTNIVSARASLSHARRFSDYIVKGQQAGSDDIDGPRAAQPSGTVKDAAVTRYRPKLILAEAPGGGADMTQRAIWDQRIDAAESLEVSVAVRGWRDENGVLWDAGQICPVSIAPLGIDQDLLIVDVEWRKDESGSASVMTLLPPEALTPEPVSVAKASGNAKSDMWRGVI